MGRFFEPLRFIFKLSTIFNFLLLGRKSNKFLLLLLFSLFFRQGEANAEFTMLLLLQLLHSWDDWCFLRGRMEGILEEDSFSWSESTSWMFELSFFYWNSNYTEREPEELVLSSEFSSELSLSE